MSEQLVDTYGAYDAPAVSPLRVRAISERLIRLVDYGAPIGITTRFPDIPGAAYNTPPPGSPDRRPFAVLGGDALSVVVEGSDVRVRVQGAEGEEPVTLLPEQIEKAYVDAPFGDRMPLAGKTVKSLRLIPSDGKAVISAIEGVADEKSRDLVATGYHPEYPGLGVVKTMRQKGQTGIFMISKSGTDRYVVSARTGCHRQVPVVVPPPRRSLRIPRLDINMVDIGATTDSLTDVHIRRHLHEAHSRAALHRPLSAHERDGVFLYILGGQ